MLAHVERNPVRAGLVRAPWRYKWSSAAAHAGKQKDDGLLDMKAWGKGWTADKWQEYLREPETPEEMEALRVKTQTGRPLAGERFVSRLERRLGRRVRALPVGRPRKRGNK